MKKALHLDINDNVRGFYCVEIINGNKQVIRSK